MAYIKLDDDFDEHRKLLRVPRALRNTALAVYTRALMYCSRHETDGVVPAGKFDAEDEIEALDALINAGLLQSHDDGFEINDYLEYNRSREEIEAVRGARREAGMKGGASTAQAKRKQMPSKCEANAKHRPSKTEANANPKTDTKTEAETTQNGSVSSLERVVEGVTGGGRHELSLPACLSTVSESVSWLSSDGTEHASAAAAVWHAIEAERNGLISPADMALVATAVTETCPATCSATRDNVNECLPVLLRAVAKTHGRVTPLFRRIAKDDRGHLR